MIGLLKMKYFALKVLVMIEYVVFHCQFPENIRMLSFVPLGDASQFVFLIGSCAYISSCKFVFM